MNRRRASRPARRRPTVTRPATDTAGPWLTSSLFSIAAPSVLASGAGASALHAARSRGGEAHGVPLDHAFHEVGALDLIVDLRAPPRAMNSWAWRS
jgi:hypothetical protein